MLDSTKSKMTGKWKYELMMKVTTPKLSVFMMTILNLKKYWYQKMSKGTS